MYSPQGKLGGAQVPPGSPIKSSGGPPSRSPQKPFHARSQSLASGVGCPPSPPRFANLIADTYSPSAVACSAAHTSSTAPASPAAHRFSPLGHSSLRRTSTTPTTANINQPAARLLWPLQATSYKADGSGLGWPWDGTDGRMDVSASISSTGAGTTPVPTTTSLPAHDGEMDASSTETSHHVREGAGKDQPQGTPSKPLSAAPVESGYQVTTTGAGAACSTVGSQHGDATCMAESPAAEVLVSSPPREPPSGWQNVQGLLGMVTCVSSLPTMLRAVKAAAVWRPGRHEGYEGVPEEEKHAGEDLGYSAELAAIEKEMACRDADQLVTYLCSDDLNLVQGALVLIVDYLNSERLTANHLLTASLVPALASLISQGPSETAMLALEALNALAIALEDVAEDHVGLIPVLPSLLHIMQTCLVASPLSNKPVVNQTQSRGSPALARGTRTAPVPIANTEERFRAWVHTEMEPDHDKHDLKGSAPAASTQPMVNSGMTHMVHCGFYSASISLRLVGMPQVATKLVQGGALRLLCGGIRSEDALLRKVCLFALYKLVHVGSHADNLVSILHAGGMDALRALLHAHATGAAVTNPEFEAAGDAPLDAMPAVAGGPAAAGGGAGSDSVRDMAAAILLDLALLPEAPTCVADHGLVAPLVQLLHPEFCPTTRMYGLLVLARLANHSLDVQLDTVREGVVPHLVSMMTAGDEHQALHAARLVAILAQSTPTHQALGTPEVMSALTPLLVSTNPLVVEHATSVFAIMANNPDTHFQLVGWGVVPRLVPLLAVSPAPDSSQSTRTTRSAGAATGAVHGNAKTQTYALATLLLLAMHEPRHADVMCRAGTIPLLVQLLRSLRPNKSGVNGRDSVGEYAAAVMSCLCRDVDTQTDIISAGGVPALVQLLADGGPQVQCHASEALVQLASVDGHRRRLIVRATEIMIFLIEFISSKEPALEYWGAMLMHKLCQEDAVLQELCDMPHALSALSHLLEDQSPNQTPEARRAQVQVAWLVAALAGSRPDVGRQLAATGIVRPLTALLAAGAESVRRGAGGALHVPLPAATADGRMSCSGSHIERTSIPVSPTTRRPLRVEPLDGNGHAASVAALLALAKCDAEIRSAVEREVIFQEVWCGRRVRLEGLAAPFTS